MTSSIFKMPMFVIVLNTSQNYAKEPQCGAELFPRLLYSAKSRSTYSENLCMESWRD